MAQSANSNDFTWGWEEWGPRPSSPVRHAPPARANTALRAFGVPHLARPLRVLA